MQKLGFKTVLVTLLIASCGNYSLAQEDTRNNTLNSKFDIYRHYKGTIGGRPAILDLRYGLDGGSNYGGSAVYYLDSNEIVNLMVLYPGIPTAMFDSAEEESWTELRDWEHKKQHPQWGININSDGIKGNRYSAGGAKSEQINLKEDYTDAYPMNVMRYRDTASVVIKNGQKCSAMARFTGIVPSANINSSDIIFINKALLKFFKEEPNGEKWTEFPHLYIERYLAEFRNNKAHFLVDTSLENMGYSSYEFFVTIFPVYNENGLMTVEISQSSTKGLYRKFTDFCNHICLDVKNKKELHLGDVLNIDSVKISALLETEARRIYKIAPQEKLSVRFTVDKIPVKDNIIISRYGLKFCYSYQEIASGYDSEMSLFIPYSALKGMMKEDFKKRMNL